MPFLTSDFGLNPKTEIEPRIDTDYEEVVEMIPKPVWCILKSVQSVVKIQLIIPATSEFGFKR